MPNPTIVAASLDDKELKNSISNLVAHVKRGLHTMLTDTDSTVDAMEKKLKSLGDLKIDSGGSADGGASRRAKAQNTETDAVEKTIAARDKQIKQNKEVEMSFDQMAKAQRQAVSPTPTQAPQIKSARESYLAFVQGFKAQGEAIARQIKDAEAALNKAVENRVNELNTKLANAKAKLNELNAELAKQRMNAERTGNYSTYNAGITRTTQAIEYQMKHIAELQKKISEVSPNMFTQQVQGISALRREQERVANIMKEDVTTRQQSTSATQQQLTAEQKLTDEIHKQAEEIRKSQQWKEKGWAHVGDRVVYNPDMPPKGWTKRQAQEMLPLEEQLLEIHRQQLSEQTKQTSEKHAQANVEKTLQQGALGRYQIEKDYYEQLKKGREIQREMQAQKGSDAYYAQLSSINMLNAKLKELRSLYADMGASERVGARGEQVAQQIRDVTRQVQKMNAELSRPKSLREALRLPEKDLDDLAYKIRQLQAYMRGLDTSNEKNAALFSKAALNAKLLKERENELLQKNSQLIYSNGQLFKSNTALGRSWNYMKNRLAFYFTVGASTAFIRNLIEVRSQYEMNERALGILIGSAERGTQVFNELSQMALVSPYTLIELSSAAKQLTAYDIAAKDVVDTTRRLADMASAVGVPIERLTYALGQIKAYGYLNSRDNRMFANAGIPLVKQLADYYTELEGRLVSTADVYDRIKKKAVSYEDTMQVINRMTDEGGRFFDFQAKMADTLKVQLANLTLAWNNMLNDIGASQQGLLTAGIGTLKDVFLAWKELSKVLEMVAVVFGLVKAQQMFANVAIGKGTVALLSYVAANKAATWQEYVRVLQTKKLTAAQAAWLVMTNQNNAALAAAVVRLKILDASMVRSLVSLKGLSLGFAKLRLGGLMALSGLVKGVKSLGAAFMSNLPLLAMTALIDAIMYAKNVGEEVLDFNKELANGAKESAKSLGDFLKESDKVQARAAAASKTLAEGEANKMWEALREQIELSSAAAKQLIPELLQVPDINERVTKAFNLADKIQEANEKLSDLKNELDINQDSWMWGAFGEGLVEDIEDYAERRKNEIEEEKYWASDELDIWKDLKYTVRGFWDGIMVGTEAFQEITKFANNAADVIREKLGKDGVRDANMVAEAIARVIAETEKKYPRIQGAGKNLFEATVTEVMSQQFAGAYKAQEFYYTKFLEQLKKDYAHTFSGVSDDIIDNAEHKWNPAQIKAIEETAKKIKTDMPEASRAAIDAIVKQLDSTDFKLHFVATFESNRSDLQRQFDRDFGDPVSGETLGVYKSLRPKESEDILEYGKNLNKTIEDGDKRYKDLIKQQKAVGGSNAALAKSLENEAIAQQKVNNAARHIKDSWHLLDEEKKKSTRGSKKDILGDALAKEVQLIGEIQKRYKEYQQMGVNAQEAVTLATEEYGNTLRRTNATLAKYGIATKSSDELAGMDIREVRDYYKALLEGAKNKDNAKGIEAIEKALANINVEITKLDYKKITDGLNNELGKLKDEYELAVELDADPELGGIFADMFDINADQLPHTISDYAARVTSELNKAIKNRGDNIQLPSITGLTNDDIKAFKKLSEEGGLNVQSFEEIKKAYKEFWELRRKAAIDVAKMVNDYIREYGNLSAQIQQIETEKNDALIKLNEIYNTNALRQTQRYVDAKNAIEDAARRKSAKAAFEALKKENDYERFFTAIDTLTRKDALQVKNRIKQGIIDAFKNGGLTVAQFRKEIKALEEQFEKLSQPTGKWFAYLNGGFEKLIQRTKETGQELEVIGEKMRATGTVDEKDKNYLQSLGNIFSDGNGNKINFSSLADSFGGDIKGLGESVSQAGMGMQSGASNFAQAVAIVDTIIKNIHQTVQAVDSVIQELNSTRSEENKIGNAYWEGFKKFDNYAYSGWEKLKSGDVAGAMADTVNSIVSIFSTFENAKNEKINKQIKDSERAVSRLEIKVESLKDSYDSMANMAERSYGTQKAAATLATSSIKEQEIALRRLQLAETRRQLQLEQSRSSKRRDTDKELSLQKEIISQQNEINSMLRETEYAIQDVVDSLLGISRGSWAEELTDALVSAFKAGEDYMKTFEESWDKMVQSMIVKTIAADIIGNALKEHVYDRIDEIVNNSTDKYRQAISGAEQHKANLIELKNADEQQWLRTVTVDFNSDFNEAMNRLGNDAKAAWNDWNKAWGYTYDALMNEYREQVRREMPQAEERQIEKEAKKRTKDFWGRRNAIKESFIPTWGDAIQNALFSIYTEREGGWESELNKATYDASNQALKQVLTGVEGEKTKQKLEESLSILPEILSQYGITYGQGAEKALSALQRGIQGVSEQTAGAIESYMNGVSQQVYLHSTILTQIRDAVVAMNGDIQLNVQGQMLLQLQQSYQVQMSIESILQGVLVPSGRAFAVELMS